MFTVKIETGFFAFHQVVPAGGSKEPLHGHNWKVEAEVCSDKLDKGGLVIDFHLLKKMVDNITVDISDNRMEECDYFKHNSTSTENVARYIYKKLQPQLPAGVKLESITVTETAGCSVKFTG